MKRAGILGLAIVLALGLVAASAQAKPKKVKVETEVSVDEFNAPDPDTVEFFGSVRAERAKCTRDRAVDLKRIDTGQVAGSDITDNAGHWEITIDGSVFPSDGVQATAKKRRYKRRRHGKVKKIIVCKAGVSPVFFPVV